MPTVSTAPRPQANNDAFHQPHKSVKASTGMNLPSLSENKEAAPQAETGQQNIVKEDKSDNAVTLSPQLTALARKQQKVQQDVQALRDKEAALAAKEADYIPRSSIKEKMEKDVTAALAELGYSYEEITTLLLNQQSSTDPTQQALKKLEAEVVEMKTSQERAVSKQYEATVAQYRKEIEVLVAKDENYSSIKEERQEAAVLQHIIDTFNEDGEVLSVEEAAKDIEDCLVEEAMRLSNLTKVKAKLKPVAEEPAKKTLPPPKSGLRTLTNEVSSAPTRTFNQSQHLSMKERIAQAVAKAQK